MRWTDKLLLRARSLLRRPRVERELDDELRFHLEQLIEENLAAGMTREEARYAARRTIGGIAQIQEECRDMRRVNWIADFLQDLHYGLRNFRRSPAFTATVLIVLALGIGANTVVFSLVDAVLLKMLPVREPGQLFQLIRPGGDDFEKEEDDFSYRMFRDLSERVAPFADLVADAYSDATPERVHRQAVSGNYFSVMGVQPAIGRTLTPDDDREPGRHPVAVISYGFWNRRFNLDPAVLGRTIRLGGNSFQIIGVMRAEFFGLQVGEMVDLWTPVAMEPTDRLTMGGYSWLRIIGRLKSRATLAQAMGPLQAVYYDHLVEDVRQAPPDMPRDLIRRYLATKIRLVPASKGISYLRRDYQQPLQIIMVVVALVLLVACTNIANLLLARGSARQREMAVRLALGAGRPRLVRQLLTESVVLAGTAAAVGLFLARWTAPVLVSLLAPSDSPVRLALDMNWRVLAFTAAVCASTALLFGVIPAFRSSNVEIHSTLKSGARVASGRTTAAKSLVALQVALSLVLLVGATLFLRTLLNLVTLDLGFDRYNLIVADIQFSGPQKDDRPNPAWGELLRRTAAIPGIESASLSRWSLFGGSNWTGIISIQGRPVDPKGLQSNFFQVSTNFFRTMGTRIIAGRDFGDRDFGSSALPVALINETLARRYFPHENPIGKALCDIEEKPLRWIQLIGIVQDTKYDSLRNPAPPLIYLPYTSGHPDSNMALEVRGHLETRSFVAALRREARAASPHFTVEKMTTQSQLVDNTLLRERLLAKLSSFFGVLALLLAAVGLYGIMSYAVTQRTQEIGIRMTLGAGRRDVLEMVLRDSILVLAVGVAVGAAVALAVTRLVSSLLFGVTAHDPAAVLISVGVLATVALGAAFIPAYRAARTDPMVALRYE